MPVKTKKIPYLWMIVGGVAVILLVVLLLPPQQMPASNPESQSTATRSTVAANPLEAEDFGYAGDYLTCLTRPSVLGIDVSVHQGDIDWTQVKAAGVEFVMLRLAYRGSIQGSLSGDEMSQTYYQGAKAAGLKVGGYIFTQSISPEEGIEDAAFVLDVVKDWQLDMPLVYDWEVIEPHYRNGNLDARTLTDTMAAFCREVEKAGYDAMVYFNINQFQERFFPEELTDYGFWLADYSEVMDFPYEIDMWQYSCTGNVPGIPGNVDLNLYFPETQ